VRQGRKPDSRAEPPAAPLRKNTIEIRDLRVRFGRQEVLRGITLDVRRNEVLGVIGPAQSGKTTLLKVINRTIEDTPDVALSGSVRVDGEDVRRMKDLPALRRKIGMVAPLPVGLPLSIFDNVAFAPRMAGLRNRTELEGRVERCLRCGFLIVDSVLMFTTLGSSFLEIWEKVLDSCCGAGMVSGVASDDFCPSLPFTP